MNKFMMIQEKKGYCDFRGMGFDVQTHISGNKSDEIYSAYRKETYNLKRKT